MNKAMDMTDSLPEYYAGMTLEQLLFILNQLERLQELYNLHTSKVGKPVALATLQALLTVHIDATDAEIGKRKEMQ
jgi:hypothetical protein